MGKISNVTVGKPDTSPASAAHTRGVQQGNKPGAFEKNPGFRRDGEMGKATAERSTGINPDMRNPIDPDSPNLSPA